MRTTNWKKVSDSGFINDFDKKLLKECEDYYDMISIGVGDDDFEESLYWEKRCLSIVGRPNGLPRKIPAKRKFSDDRVPMWNIAEKLKIDHLAGNTNQVQLPSSQKQYTKAIYKFMDGEWYCKLHPEIIEKISEKYDI